MRILFLSQLIPYPADAGPKIRSYHVLQHLRQAGHDVTLVAFRRQEDEDAALEQVRRVCSRLLTVPMRRSRLKDGWHLLRSFLTGHPFLISRDGVGAMHRLVGSLLEEAPFDLIHVDQLWMAQYALQARSSGAAAPRPRVTLDQHNAVHLIPARLAGSSRNPVKRALLQWEARRLERYEVEVCQQVDHLVWVSQEDRAALRRAGLPSSGWLTEEVIPICIDLTEKRPLQRTARPRRVTFLGGLNWPPNWEGVLWFVREVWPLVVERFPDVTLTVIGKQPATPLATLPSGVASLEVTGYVADPRPYLEESAVFIVPLHAGGGMRVKIVDAWGWGLPIVSTAIGAEGTCCQDGHNLLIADQPDTFAAAIIRLLEDPEFAAQLGQHGRETCERWYDWRSSYSAWDRIYGRSAP